MFVEVYYITLRSKLVSSLCNPNMKRGAENQLGRDDEESEEFETSSEVCVDHASQLVSSNHVFCSQAWNGAFKKHPRVFWPQESLYCIYSSTY